MIKWYEHTYGDTPGKTEPLESQWCSQRVRSVGAAAPLAENPELHCILLLHNFKTVTN